MMPNNSQNNTPKLIIATHNAHKLRELREMIATFQDSSTASTSSPSSSSEMLFPEDIVSARELNLNDPIEDGATFEENALIKARYVYEQTGIAAIADDSGLIVNILGRAPGILSARWSGVHGNDKANNSLLLNQLEGLPRTLRRAHFKTACAFVYGDSFNEQITKAGEMHGEIIYEQRGEFGFGYDSMFIPDALKGTLYDGLTSGEIPPEVKNDISHRSQALKSILPSVLKVLNEK